MTFITFFSYRIVHKKEKIKQNITKARDHFLPVLYTFFFINCYVTYDSSNTIRTDRIYLHLRDLSFRFFSIFWSSFLVILLTRLRFEMLQFGRKFFNNIITKKNVIIIFLYMFCLYVMKKKLKHNPICTTPV